MKRCAIYTRKSTDEGLEQNFNSLHAQREACEAYIKSQTHEAWRPVKTTFDDGGYSGGSMDRPGLADLIDEIKDRKIDVVVVYKVDRLTRSLADFAKLVELFDAHGVSFVSVTQQFNTTTSMGRLTLNVLLSFAQFEREVTAERIRDKVAASKKKGIWMGGPVPLGYDVVDRKLIVNETEAKTVGALFDLYAELGSVRALKEEADRRGLVTKRRMSTTGRVTGGKPFSRGNLYALLSSPIYKGDLPHKGDSHPGQHDAIIDPETWERVQRRLKENAVDRRTGRNASSPSLLTGLVYDETGDLLTPSHATKKGRRYHYYVSHRLLQGDVSDGSGWRLQAKTLENVVLKLVIDHLQRTGIDLPNESVPAKADALCGNDFLAKRITLQRLVHRIDLTPSEILIRLKDTQPHSIDAEGSFIRKPITLRRRGVERRIVIEGIDTQAREPDQALCRLIGQARVWMRQLASGEMPSVDALGARENRHPADVSRVLQLNFLAPDIVEAILDGRQPIELNTQMLMRLGTLPADWHAQRRLLGFAA